MGLGQLKQEWNLMRERLKQSNELNSWFNDLDLEVKVYLHNHLIELKEIQTKVENEQSRKESESKSDISHIK